MHNKNKTLAILTLISLGFFIGSPICLGAEQDIVITEIVAYPVSAEEWLEIYNKGSEAVDLTNWRFYEAATNHKLTASQNDFIIEPDEYAIIANNAETFKQKFPAFTGTILDSSWSSLNESGEEIGLKNSLLETIELFTYLVCPDTSLQRLDPNLPDYTANNWQVHQTDNSAGRANEFPGSPTPEPEPDPEPEPEPNPDPEPEPPPETAEVNIQRIISGSILINEFVSDAETEWIELYNRNSSTIDLTGWQILDGADTATTLEGEIKANNNEPFFLIEAPKGKLNNSGDAIILKDKSNNIIDVIYYGDWDHQDKEKNTLAPGKNFSTARTIDGGNTNNSLIDFSLTKTPTKGQPNKITLDENTENANTTPANKKTTAKSASQIENQIIITEIFPNPWESDLENEFIELKNLGPEAVDLINWQIQDNSERIYIINQKDFTATVLAADSYVLIPRKISGLALDNDKDTIKLINPANKTIATVKYNEAEPIAENLSYSLTPQNQWLWTTTPTPLQNNIINPVNQAPIIELTCTENSKINEKISCDASDSYDLENNPLTFTWIVEEQIFSGPILAYLNTQPQDIEITLNLNDGQKTSMATKKIKMATVAKTVKKATSSSKSTSKTTTSKTTSKKVASIINADLNKVKTLATGTKVKTQGVVSVLPNTFGKTIMYVAGSGIQLYMSKSDWPNLKIGDVVEITGTLSTVQGEKRIKLAKQTDLQIIANQDPPAAKLIQAEEINPDLVGYLVQVSGQLIEKNGLNFYLQDETGEAHIYIKTATKINKSDYAEGDNLQITGILSQTNETYKILPRFAADLLKKQLNPISAAQAAVSELPVNNQNKTITKYLIAAFISLFILTGLVLYKNQQQKGSK